jgi:hypothetical protein
MYQDPTLPPRTRNSVPAVLALDMILYLVAHLATLSFVNFDTSLAGDQIRNTRFMGFSFFEADLPEWRQ